MSPLRERAALAALVAFAALLLLPGLGRMAAYDPTDARYLEVSREMAVAGDLWIPRLAGVAHLDKPPLAYWAAIAGFRLFGVSEFGGRVVEELALLATAGLVFGYGRRWLGPRAALSAALVFLTSLLVFITSRGLSTDLFQLFFLTWSLLLLFDATTGTRPVRNTALALALLGASMLAKGPIALLVCVSVLAPFLALTSGRTRLPGRAVLLGAIGFACIGLPWHALLVLRDPQLLGYFVGSQLIGRATGGGAGHEHGLAYLWGAWGVGLLPWTPLVALALWRIRPRRGDRERDPLDLYLLLWASLPVLLFSLFATKLPTYILPAFPAAALAVGRAICTGGLDDAWGRRARSAACITVGLLAAVLAGALGAIAGFGPEWIGGRLAAVQLEIPGLFAALLGSAGAAALPIARALGSRTASRALPMLAAYAGGVFFLGFQTLAPGLSGAAEVGTRVASVPGARLVEYGGFHPGPLFYTGRVDRFHLAEVKRFDSLELNAPEPPNLFLSHDEALALLGDEHPTFLYVAERRQSQLGLREGIATVWSGRHHVLLANAAALRSMGAAPEARAHERRTHRRRASAAAGGITGSLAVRASDRVGPSSTEGRAATRSEKATPPRAES